MARTFLFARSAFAGIFVFAAASNVQAQQTIYAGSQNSGEVERFTTTGTRLSNLTTISNQGGTVFITVDPSGHVYVTDPSVKKIREFSSAGVSMGFFASYNNFAKVKADASGNIFVADTDNAHPTVITKYSPAGANLLQFTTVNQIGDIATDSAGNIFVSGLGSSVSKYNSNGVFLNTIGAGFANAEGLAFDSAGNLDVTDFRGNSIRRFAPNGTELSPFVASIGQQAADQIVFDTSGNAYVDGNVSGGIYQFDSSGNQTAFFSVPFPSSPRSIAIGPAASSTPEPGTLALLTGLGLSGSLCVLRRRRK